jgi:hypothetical protein
MHRSLALIRLSLLNIDFSLKYSRQSILLQQGVKNVAWLLSPFIYHISSVFSPTTSLAISSVFDSTSISIVGV